MQLQTETRPALTGPAVVEHADVQLPASDLPVSLLISTESSEQSRQRSLIIGEAAFAQHSSARLAPRAVRGLDDATLNKPQGRTVNLAMPIEEIFAAPIEVWEGEVKMVDGKAQTMHVYLRSKVALASDHAAEIDLEWVPEQDKD